VRWNFIHQLPHAFTHRNVTVVVVVVVVVVIGDISKDPRSLENQTANGSRRDATADSSSTSTH
jgi:hypothetical protein